MTRQTLTVLVATLVALGPQDVLLAQRGSRGSVSGASRSRWVPRRRDRERRALGMCLRPATATTVVGKPRLRAGLRRVSSGVWTPKTRASSAPRPRLRPGLAATRTREAEAQGGYATVEGSGSTSTGREASGEGVAGRNAYGQPTVAGSVDTKYTAATPALPLATPVAATPAPRSVPTAARSPPPSRPAIGRPPTTDMSYYAYGGAYYRPYTHGGVHYYYPVPPPDHAYYSSPPVGAMVLMVAGVAYLMSQDGSYSKQTTNSDGKVAYQVVPAPQGARSRPCPSRACWSRSPV